MKTALSWWIREGGLAVSGIREIQSDAFMAGASLITYTIYTQRSHNANIGVMVCLGMI
jgi:hypothetical protein